MSRKEASFAQLLGYMDKGAGENAEPFTHNLHPGQSHEYVREFEKNSEHMAKRKNGVFLYHEILSFKNNDGLSWAEKSEKLREIAEEYIQRRSPTSLAYGVIHDDKDHHTHIHLCISSNGLEDSKRIRLSKTNFGKMKVDFEKYVLATYPELGQEVSIDKSKDTPHTPKGGELKRRKGKLSKKEETVERFRDVFTHAKTKEEFFALMGDKNLEIYTRGKTVGFLDTVTGKKYRLKTLGLALEFSRASDRLDLEGRRQVIDYMQAKGRADRVERTPEKKPQSTTKKDPTSPKTESPVTEVKNSPSDTGTVREWIGGDFTERDARITAEKIQARKDAFKEKDRKDKEILSEKTPRPGRFGTAREWIAGDFSERDAQARQDESAERIDRWEAQQEEKRQAEQEKDTSREKTDRVAKRKEKIKTMRDAKGKDSPNKDTPDIER